MAGGRSSRMHDENPVIFGRRVKVGAALLALVIGAACVQSQKVSIFEPTPIPSPSASPTPSPTPAPSPSPTAAWDVSSVGEFPFGPGCFTSGEDFATVMPPGCDSTNFTATPK